MRRLYYVLVIFITLAFLAGCSGSSESQSPVSPGLDSTGASHLSNTYLLGLYRIVIDPETVEADIIPLRSAEIEINVLKFLEPPDSISAILIDNVVIDPPSGLEFELGILHPYAGTPEFSIFSTRGVFLTNGSMGGFENPSIVMSGPDELRLLNADGMARWMNPVEFPFDGTILNYYPGKYGNPDGHNYTSTINPYKLYANGLSAQYDNLDLDEEDKAMFRAGTLVWRHYELDSGSQGLLDFQYAIVASWEPPLNNPPSGPDDYPPGTVASEPWRVEINELNNTLTYDDGIQAGWLGLEILVRDFENADQDKVFVEAPGIFPRQEATLVDIDGGHLTFELSVAGIDLTSADTFETLVAAVATDGEGYDGRLPGEELATYMMHEVTVKDNFPLPAGWPFYDDFENYDYEWTAYGGDWWGEYDGNMDARGDGMCYEEEKTGDDQWDENPNVSFVSSPPIEIPTSSDDLLIVFNHAIKVDIPEEMAWFTWDMCYIRVNGAQVDPSKIVGGPAYEHGHYPWTFDDMWCWTSYYNWTESTFNLGTEYNGTTIVIDFVLDTYDYIDNCNPPNSGWRIDDILVDFAD